MCIRDSPERVTLLTFDVVIVMADDHLFIEIKKEIERFGIDKKIVPYKVCLLYTSTKYQFYKMGYF